MARRVFFSFHHKADAWRASQVRNMGVVEGNTPVTDNDWEAVKKGGDKAIAQWIDDQLHGRSCAIVLIGENTAGRKWIKYEIEQAWNAKKGVLGIYVHNLKDSRGNQANKGDNPFSDFTLTSGRKLSSVAKTYTPPYTGSVNVYDHIKEYIDEWVEEAIEIRNNC